MPGLRDILKKKEKIAAENEAPTDEQSRSSIPEFKFIRSTTNTEELIQIPSYPDTTAQSSTATDDKAKRSSEHKRHFAFRKSSNAEITRDPTAVTESTLPARPKEEKRLSSRLHLRKHSRTPSAESSTHLPSDLPDAPATLEPSPSDAKDPQEEKAINEQREAQWEKRATVLAESNPLIDQHQQRQQQQHQSRTPSPTPRGRTRSKSPSISSQRTDENIQEAIRLHEIGHLDLSTAMFGRLSDPQGANNALAQVLYGLALRHGWGVTPEPEKAIHYLSLAAANSASVEREALENGIQRGGAAKGELVLAIFELGNCFRHAWGVAKDPVAARSYYETAANLGDVDAMEEVAWCYLEGFGGAKDKFTAAKYLRLAEEKGHKTVGNSWIWKEKYNSPKT